MPLIVGTVLPALDGADRWFNVSKSLDEFSETVRRTTSIVHFWAKSCPACKSNMPRLQLLRDEYAARGLKTIAVHMPRGEFDLDIDAVKAAALGLGITEPCAIDNDHNIGGRFDVKVWPTYYLFDANGQLKRHAAGGFGVRMIEAALKDMFGE